MNYYVNKKEQLGGEHEVHTESCYYLPIPENRLYLGSFTNCADALKEARKYYPKVDGCAFCCSSCHTR